MVIENKNKSNDIGKTITRFKAIPFQNIKRNLKENTVKESSIQIPYQTFFIPINQDQSTTYSQDIAKSIRELAKIPYQTFVTPINQDQKPISSKDDMKNHLKENNYNDIPSYLYRNKLMSNN